MNTWVATCTSALLARSSASVSVYPICETIIAQVHPSYFTKKEKVSNEKIIKTTLVDASTSALLARSSASVSVCPALEALCAQVHPL